MTTGMGKSIFAFTAALYLCVSATVVNADAPKYEMMQAADACALVGMSEQHMESVFQYEETPGFECCYNVVGILNVEGMDGEAHWATDENNEFVKSFEWISSDGNAEKLIASFTDVFGGTPPREIADNTYVWDDGSIIASLSLFDDQSWFEVGVRDGFPDEYKDPGLSDLPDY